MSLIKFAETDTSTMIKFFGVIIAIICVLYIPGLFATKTSEKGKKEINSLVSTGSAKKSARGKNITNKNETLGSVMSPEGRRSSRANKGVKSSD